MPFCTNCGEELPEAAKFCSKCGTQISSGNHPQPTRRKNNEPTEPERPKKKRKSKLLPVLALILVLAAVAIKFLGNGSVTDTIASFLNQDGDDNVPAYNDSPFEMTTDEEMEMNSYASNSYGEYAGSAALKEMIDNNAENSARSGEERERIEGIRYLDEMSESEQEEYQTAREERVYGDDIKNWRASYEGTWESVGVYDTDFSEFVDLNNSEVASLIDRNMVPANTIKFVFDNHFHGTAAFWTNGKLTVEGRYTIGDCGNMCIDAGNDDNVYFWMYSPTGEVLFCYVYYIDDDGTEKAAGVKLNRTSE